MLKYALIGILALGIASIGFTAKPIAPVPDQFKTNVKHPEADKTIESLAHSFFSDTGRGLNPTGVRLLGSCENYLRAKTETERDPDAMWCLGFVQSLVGSQFYYHSKGYHEKVTYCVPKKTDRSAVIQAIVTFLRNHADSLVNTSAYLLAHDGLSKHFPCKK